MKLKSQLQCFPLQRKEIKGGGFAKHAPGLGAHLLLWRSGSWVKRQGAQRVPQAQSEVLGKEGREGKKG